MAADLPTRPSLLVRLRDANDHAAWSQFVSVYTPLIFGFCCKRGLNETAAGDVCQEVLRAIAKAIPQYQYDPGRSTFRNWLFTVVRSKFNNHLASQARQPRLAGDTTIHAFTESEADPALEESWRREYQANLIQWAATQIQKEFKAQTWDAFRRTALLGEAAEVVAGELGLSLNALYVARSRVTRRLKEAIESIEKGAGSIESLAHG